MTNIHWSWNEISPPRFRLEVAGHTDYSGAEGNLVCAAVSILTQALMAWVQAQAKFGFVDKVNALRQQEGYALIDVTVRPAWDARTLGAFSVILDGFRLLAETYPENVRFGEKASLWEAAVTRGTMGEPGSS